MEVGGGAIDRLTSLPRRCAVVTMQAVKSVELVPKP